MYVEMYVEMLNLGLKEGSTSTVGKYALSSFQYTSMQSLRTSSSSVEEAKPVIIPPLVTDLGRIVHHVALFCTTYYSRREIRIVWRSGVCKLPVVSEAFGNAVSGAASMSSSSSCCPPISLLRWSPKPLQCCCAARSYTCIDSLAAPATGISDTSPVVPLLHPILFPSPAVSQHRLQQPSYNHYINLALLQAHRLDLNQNY
jgi:hypothetical protein